MKALAIVGLVILVVAIVGGVNALLAWGAQCTVRPGSIRCARLVLGLLRGRSGCRRPTWQRKGGERMTWWGAYPRTLQPFVSAAALLHKWRWDGGMVPT